jgi:hypothetical protein
MIFFDVYGTESHFRESLGVERAARCLAALRDATERARDEVAREGHTQRRTEPAIAFDLATSAFEAEFAPEDGVVKATSRGQIFWVVDQTYGMRIKRHTAYYETVNHASGQQSAILAQAALPGLDPLYYVSIGPRISFRTGLVMDYVVVKHILGRNGGREVEWVIDLADLAGGSVIPMAPILPLSPAAPAAGVRSRRLGVIETDQTVEG